MTESTIRFLDELGSEFDRLGHEHRKHASRPNVRRGLRRTPLAAGLLALAIAGGATAAGVGLSDLTKTITGDSNATTLAEGTTDDGRDWLISTGSKDGNFCLTLRLSAPNEAPRAAVNCGGLTPNTFGVNLGNAGDVNAQNLLLFGTAPDAAERIEVREGDTVLRQGSVVDAPGEVAGRVFFVEAPRAAATQAALALVGDDGQTLTTPSTLIEVIRPATPVSP